MRHQLYKDCVHGVELHNYSAGLTSDSIAAGVLLLEYCCRSIPRKNHRVSLAFTLKWSVGPKHFLLRGKCQKLGLQCLSLEVAVLN